MESTIRNPTGYQSLRADHSESLSGGHGPVTPPGRPPSVVRVLGLVHASAAPGRPPSVARILHPHPRPPSSRAAPVSCPNPQPSSVPPPSRAATVSCANPRPRPPRSSRPATVSCANPRPRLCRPCRPSRLRIGHHLFLNARRVGSCSCSGSFHQALAILELPPQAAFWIPSLSCLWEGTLYGYHPGQPSSVVRIPHPQP